MITNIPVEIDTDLNKLPRSKIQAPKLKTAIRLGCYPVQISDKPCDSVSKKTLA